MSRLRGFTLIELVATMIVIGILAAVAVGRMDFNDTFEQRAVYDKLKAGLEFARKSAIAKRRHVQVSFAGGDVGFLYDGNTPENSLRDFAAANHLNLPAPDSDCGAGNEHRICSRTGATIAVAAGAAPFTFNPQGAASATVGFSVTGMPAIACGGGSAAICVESQTGYVR